MTGLIRAALDRDDVTEVVVNRPGEFAVESVAERHRTSIIELDAPTVSDHAARVQPGVGRMNVDGQQTDAAAGQAMAVAPPGWRHTASRYWLLVVSAILIAVSGFGLWRIGQEYPRTWATMLPHTADAEGPAIDLQTAMVAVSEADPSVGPDVPKAYLRLPLAEFVQRNGRRVQVVLVQGEFFDAAIEPREVWRSVGQHVLLVSSVDENRSEMGPLSGPLAKGCDARSAAPIQQGLGATPIVRCKGPYNDAFHVDWLARMSVVIEQSIDPTKAACWTKYGIGGAEGDYQACLTLAVHDGLENLFRGAHEKDDLDAMVVPAIGTGVGKLSKAAFYNQFFETLVAKLDQDRRLPPTIYLQVRRADPDRRWPETRIAIAGALATAVQTWNDAEHKHGDSEWVTLTGVCAGSALLLLALAFRARTRLLLGLEDVLSRPRPLVVVAWIAGSVGLVSMLKAATSFLPPTFEPYPQLIAGFVAALICAPLMRAKGAFEKGVMDAEAPRLGQAPPNPPPTETSA